MAKVWKLKCPACGTDALIDKSVTLPHLYECEACGKKLRIKNPKTKAQTSKPAQQPKPTKPKRNLGKWLADRMPRRVRRTNVPQGEAEGMFYVEVLMSAKTYKRFAKYLAFQSAMRITEEGKLMEQGADEAINELITLYVENAKIFGKASTKLMVKGIRKAQGEVDD